VRRGGAGVGVGATRDMPRPGAGTM
jgi:hypothetical protein